MRSILSRKEACFKAQWRVGDYGDDNREMKLRKSTQSDRIAFMIAFIILSFKARYRYRILLQRLGRETLQCDKWHIVLSTLVCQFLQIS